MLQSNHTVADGLRTLYRDFGDCDATAVLDEGSDVYVVDLLRAEQCGIASLPYLR